MPIVALSGFMGSGKSVVGAHVARVLGWRFFDLDEEIERRTGTTIERLFAEAGEPAFRMKELETIRELLGPEARDGESTSRYLPTPGTLLALGGGTLTVPETADLLSERAVIIHLDVTPDEAWTRVAGSDRPLAQEIDSFRRLAEERELAYRAVADFVVPTGGRQPSDIVAEVAALAAPAQPGAGSSVDAASSDWSLVLDTAEGRSAIHGGPGALRELERWSAVAAERGVHGFVITDRHVSAAVGDAVLRHVTPGFLGAAPRTIEPGETSKNVATANALWEWLAQEGARRDDIVVALGGGVVGDVAGFVAATYMRGIRLWQIPTTLVAQVDSSVGGKTAVDLTAGKNLVGAFHQPELVIIEPRLLASLRRDDLRSGLGEVVKYALLDGEALLLLLEDSAPRLLTCRPGTLGDIIRRCVAHKAVVVREDTTDRGRRATLNLGHTAAHALEAAMGYGRIAHGVAVALGILVALTVSEQETGLRRDVRPRVRRLLQRLGLPVSLELPPTERLLEMARRDKKADARGSGFVCLEAVGRPVWGIPVSAETLGRAFEVVRT